MRDFDTPDPVNCPNCGRFMGWDSEKEEYTCSCGGAVCHKDPDRPGWITVSRARDVRVHERRRSRGTEQ